MKVVIEGWSSTDLLISVKLNYNVNIETDTR